MDSASADKPHFPVFPSWSQYHSEPTNFECPLGALYLPLVFESSGSLPALLALAFGSTIAGNLMVLVAASNVIMIQRAEQERHTLSFRTFAWIGVPLTILQTLVYAVYREWSLG